MVTEPQMRKLWIALVGLVQLTSCVDVQDYGLYWDKAGTDRRLAGNWKMIAANASQTSANGYEMGTIFKVAQNRGSYEISVSGDKAEFSIKTLDVGRYQFFLIGPGQGTILRYKLHGRTLEVCIPNLVDFVKTHYPNAVNIKDKHDENRSSGITRFDEGIFNLLSNVPDGGDYWDCELKFERVQ